MNITIHQRFMKSVPRKAFTPDPEYSATYDRLFQDYKKAYKLLKKANKQSNEARFANQNKPL